MAILANYYIYCVETIKQKYRNNYEQFLRYSEESIQNVQIDKEFQKKF